MKTIETGITSEEFIYETETMLKEIFIAKVVRKDTELYVRFCDGSEFRLSISKTA